MSHTDNMKTETQDEIHQIACTRPTIVDEVSTLLDMTASSIRDQIDELSHDFKTEDIVEITMDLHRPFEIFYFNNRRIMLRRVSQEDVDHIVTQLNFGSDNRASIEHSLHRISWIRNRYGKIVGLTLRVGRAVLGISSRLCDIVSNRDSSSILLLGALVEL